MSFEQQVTNAWTAGVIFTVVVVVFFVLSYRSEDHGPTLLARLIDRYFAPRRVSDYDDNALYDMSSAATDAPQFRPSSLGTDGPPDGRTAQPTKPNAEQLLTLYKLMREYGIKRDEAAAALRVANLPLSNDVWRKAEPPPRVPTPSNDDDVMITPYAGRRTRASYYPDEPELEFKSPA